MAEQPQVVTGEGWSAGQQDRTIYGRRAGDYIMLWYQLSDSRGSIDGFLGKYLVAGPVSGEEPCIVTNGRKYQNHD